MPARGEPVTTFQNLADFVALPRVTALRLSPDGSWLAAAVQNVSGEPAKYVTSIFRISTTAGGPPLARLTRSAEGEGGPEFLPDGSLLFISKRPGPPPGPDDGEAGQDGAAQDQDQPGLWLLPAGGGEARRIAALPGGVAGIAAADDTGTIVLASPALPGTSGADEDAKRRKARKDAGVTAILYESGALRYWDHDLGPAAPRLFAAEITVSDEAVPQLRDLTPDPGRALDECSFEVAPDGGLAVTTWRVWDETGNPTDEIQVIDMATGDRRVLLSAPGVDFESPIISPDGRLVASIQTAHDSYEVPGPVTLVVTCSGTWTGARSRRPGPLIPARSTSPPTIRAGGPCSAPTWPPAR
jgi:dipeptidyl aminopeptidase/acylaminoacyl peptidase